MVNPFDYLYYKICIGLASLIKWGSPIRYAGIILLLFILNSMTLCILITGELSEPFAYVSGFLITVFFALYYLFKRDEKIIAKYSKESEKSRMIGNTAVWLYVIVTFVAFALVIKAHQPPKPVNDRIHNWWEIKK